MQSSRTMLAEQHAPTRVAKNLHQKRAMLTAPSRGEGNPCPPFSVHPPVGLPTPAWTPWRSEPRTLVSENSSFYPILDRDKSRYIPRNLR